MKEREIIAREWRDDKGTLHRREVGQELVRCKECKYYAEHNELYINAPTNCVKHSTINHYVVVNADDFCSYGERRRVERQIDTEPQIDGYMTAEQAEDYCKMLDKAEHKVYGNIEDEPQTERSE